MKVTITQGAETSFPITLEDGAKVGSALEHATTVTVCGMHSGARVNSAEVTGSYELQDGDVVEPFTKSNDKG